MTKRSEFDAWASVRVGRHLVRAALLLTALFAAGCDADPDPSDAMVGNILGPTQGNTPAEGGTTVPDGGGGSGSDAGAGPSQAATPMDGGGAPVGADAGPLAEAGAPVDAGPVANCTPVAWENPGKVPNPEVMAAPDAGHPWGTAVGLAEFDYVEEEFFFKGSSPAYTSRMLVHRPRDPAKFSGTVFVEWYNVSGGIDFAPLWALSREYFLREGHVHVKVSAQAVGAVALKDNNAERYASISHPGDDAANAIFSQAAMAIRSQGEKLLGRCMPVQAVLSVGQSQSAGRLASYIDQVQTKDQIYDGHLVHSGFGAPSSTPDVPVFLVNTMNEADGTVINQPNMVEWEVAAASHNDAHIMARAAAELGMEEGVVAIECAAPLNDFPAFWVYNAALDWLHRWARKGEKPPSGAPYQTGTGGAQLDPYGNVLGGVRIQDVEVPIATYGNENGPTNPFDIIGYLACGLGGSTVPFTKERMLQLYPTHEAYVEKYTQAAEKAVASGYLLRADYELAVQKAKSAPIPN